jgi:serine acetyltransferase
MCPPQFERSDTRLGPYGLSHFLHLSLIIFLSFNCRRNDVVIAATIRKAFEHDQTAPPPPNVLVTLHWLFKLKQVRIYYLNTSIRITKMCSNPPRKKSCHVPNEISRIWTGLHIRKLQQVGHKIYVDSDTIVRIIDSLNIPTENDNVRDL